MNRRSGGTVAQSGGAVGGGDTWRRQMVGSSWQSRAGDQQAAERCAWAVGVLPRGNPDAGGCATPRLTAAGVWWPVTAIRDLQGRFS